MFTVVNIRTGEISNTLDFCSRVELDKAFREPGMRGDLRCLKCREVVVLHREFESYPHFFHQDFSPCSEAHLSLSHLEARAALFHHLRREFGENVSVEHDMQHTAVRRAVDCWVEHKGKTFAYWIFDENVKNDLVRAELQKAFLSSNVICHFAFTLKMLQPAGSGEGVIKPSATEKFAKVCTPYDVLNGKNEGGSLHYIGVEEVKTVLVTYRTLVGSSKSKMFSGIRKKHFIADTEVCNLTGHFVHPEEKRFSEILRTRQNRQDLVEDESSVNPQVLAWKKERAKIELLPRTGKTFREIMSDILRPRADMPSIKLYREREAPCEFCGVVTRDWIVFNGATGLCKCRHCYEDRAAACYRGESQKGGEG